MALYLTHPARLGNRASRVPGTPAPGTRGFPVRVCAGAGLLVLVAWSAGRALEIPRAPLGRVSGHAAVLSPRDTGAIEGAGSGGPLAGALAGRFLRDGVAPGFRDGRYAEGMSGVTAADRVIRGGGPLPAAARRPDRPVVSFLTRVVMALLFLGSLGLGYLAYRIVRPVVAGIRRRLPGGPSGTGGAGPVPGWENDPAGWDDAGSPGDAFEGAGGEFGGGGASEDW